MDTFLDRLQSLMDEKKVNAKQVTSEAGIASSAITDWKKGRAKPSLPAAISLAKYFDVSLDFLVLGKRTDIPVIQGVTGVDEDLLRKFHALTPDLQDRLMSYADGLLAAMPQKEDELGEKLSV